MTGQPLTFGMWLAGIIARWRLILRVLAATIVAAILAVVLLPPVYRASSSFVAAGSSGGKVASALSGAGGSGLSGIASQLGVTPGTEPSESPGFYVNLIQSAELRRRLLRSKFRDPRAENPTDSATLLEILRVRGADSLARMEKGVKLLGKAMAVGQDIKTSMVFVTVELRWSDLAAATANRAITLVDSFNHEQRVSRARSKRIFLEGRLDSARAGLSVAEERQRYFYEQNRLWRNSPQLVFEEGRLQRNVETASSLFLMLQGQFESARLDEFNDAAVITVVDPAVPPRKAEWPRYWIMLASALSVGTLLGVLFAGAVTILADWRDRNPQTASALGRSLAGLPIPFRARNRDPRA